MEDNKLIAEFMGMEVSKENPTVIIDTNYVIPKIRHMMYDSSWDWLMPVQKKVSEIYHEDAQRMHFEKADMFDKLEMSLFNADIESAYKIIVEFIKWYNENKED